MKLLKIVALALSSLSLCNGTALSAEYPANRFGGFTAFTLFKTSKVNDEYNNPRETELGLGTVSLSAYSGFDQTRFKLKLDIDSGLSTSGKLIEIAKLSQRLSESLTFEFGKGKVKFHNYDYGVTEETYLDAGSLLAPYNINWREIDKKIVMALKYRGDNFSSATTLYSDVFKVIQKNSDGSFRTNDDGEPLLEDLSNSVDPNDQFGIAQRFDFRSSSALTYFVGAAHYYHKLFASRNNAVIAGLEYNLYEYIIIAEALVGSSSDYRIGSRGAEGKKDWSEKVARVQLQYRPSRAIEFLLDLETASYDFYSLSDPVTGEAFDDITEGLLFKSDVGIAYHISPRVKITTGALYEYHIFSDYQNEDTEETAWKVSSSMTYAF